MRVLIAVVVFAVSVSSQQYKRLHQRALRDLVDAGPAACEERLAGLDADDPQTDFVRALAAAAAGDAAAAASAARRAIAAGLPAGRFLAGPWRFTRPLLADPDLAAEIRAAAGPIVHGPMLGDPRPDGMRIWLRARDREAVTVEVRDRADGPVLARATARPGDDHVAVLEVTGLEPAQRYRYTLVVGEERVAGGRFRTAPPHGAGTRLTFAFGGGAGFVPANERVWDTIGGFAPDFLLLLGDNVYIDDPTRPEVQQYTYARRQSRPEWRRLVRDVPVLATWDDHDFGTNDCHGGPAPDDPSWKPAVGRLFRRQWANPVSAAGGDDPGQWFSFRYGDIAFVVLDGRCYRTDPRADAPSMLGPAQFEWLERTLRDSDARAHVLCSPVPWVFAAKGDSLDTWNGFRAEREQVFGLLDRHAVAAPLLLSADRHRSDAWRIDRDDRPPLYEFNSSRLTNQHVHARMERALFSYNAKQSFGLVTIDTATAEVPRAVYRIVDIDGRVQHELAVEPGR